MTRLIFRSGPSETELFERLCRFLIVAVSNVDLHLTLFFSFIFWPAETFSVDFE